MKFIIYLIFALYVTPAWASSVAPDITWIDRKGTHKLSDFRGTPVILHFWASWCGSCKTEMSEIVSFIEYGIGKSMFVALSIDDSLTVAESSMIRFSRSNKIPVGVTSRLSVQKFLFRSIPSTVVVDKDGIIVAEYIGPAPWNNYLLTKAVLSLSSD